MSNIALLAGGIMLGMSTAIICVTLGYTVGKHAGYSEALADEYNKLDDTEAIEDDLS